MRLFTLLTLAFLTAATAHAQANLTITLAPTYATHIQLHYTTPPHATPAPHLTLDASPAPLTIPDGITATSECHFFASDTLTTTVLPHRDALGGITVVVTCASNTPGPNAKFTVTRTLVPGKTTRLGTLFYKGDPINVDITAAELTITSFLSPVLAAPPTISPNPYAAWKITLLNASHP